jgi:hypothetical protein
MSSTPATPFSVLRQFARPRRNVERCELCSQELPPEHGHLLDMGLQPEQEGTTHPVKVLCSCRAGALLFEGRANTRYRLIPTEVRYLPNFRMTDAQWDSLRIPINLAFFFHSSKSGKVVAQYPSPAGAIEALLPLDTWPDLVEQNEVLRQLQPDVEALLINRVGASSCFYCAPIDECYKLVGLIRTTWRGLSGGSEVWEAIERFFASLHERSSAQEG